jgi:transcriptional regulator with PAS, ATPase and Fis domain
MFSLSVAPLAWLGVVERLVAACPAPALVISAGGTIGSANEPVRRLFARRFAQRLVGLPVREVLGLGWLELSLAGRDGDADLVADLQLAGPGEPPARGWRLRPEPVEGQDGLTALVVFLEPPAEAAAEPRSASRQRDGFAAMFGHDPALRSTKEAAERFARTRLPILLLAETGTGKELLARAIHLASPRRERAFVAINCGALSPHLLESELFGYAPGAFTGASREGSDGKIGAARGGTLFLDEVAEMPGPLQALLLRVLEDGTYYRVGDNLPRHADIRLVCATCRDLPRMVEEGAFRQDLFYRIDGACLTLPPLRERSDLPELTMHLLACLTEEDGDRRSSARLDPEAFAWLIAQPWPGNVRQLKTALQHALVLAGGGEIRREHLPVLVGGLPRSAGARVTVLPAETRFPPPALPPASPELPPTARSLDELEAEIVRQAVEQAGGNLSLAARRLGIARTTLYRRLRREEG